MEQYQKTKLTKKHWHVLERIAAAGWQGTRTYRMNPNETFRLRELGLVKRGWTRDGATVDCVTEKGRWWLHWHKADIPQNTTPKPVQKSFI